MFDDFHKYETLLAQLQLVFFMLGMGATLSAADFVRVARFPKFLVVGAVMQLAVLPLLAVAVNAVSGVEPGIAVGLVLVSALPGGVMSKLFVYMGRGNVALTITLTVMLTIGSIVTVPLLLDLLVRGYVPADFVMPVADVVREVGLFLLLPLAIGLLIGHLVPAHRKLVSRCCVSLGLVFVVLVIVGSLGAGRIRPTAYGWTAPLAIIAFCLLGQQVAMLPFRLMRWPAGDCLAVGIEVTMRNINLGILLWTSLKRGRPEDDPIMGGVFFVLLYYAGTAMVLGAPLALRFRFFKRG